MLQSVDMFVKHFAILSAAIPLVLTALYIWFNIKTGDCYFINPILQCISQKTFKSNIKRSLVGNKIVDHSDVVGAAATTTFSYST